MAPSAPFQQVGRLVGHDGAIQTVCFTGRSVVNLFWIFLVVFAGGNTLPVCLALTNPQTGHVVEWLGGSTCIWKWKTLRFFSRTRELKDDNCDLALGLIS
jgi:hypothetical protein